MQAGSSEKLAGSLHGQHSLHSVVVLHLHSRPCAWLVCCTCMHKDTVTSCAGKAVLAGTVLAPTRFPPCLHVPAQVKAKGARKITYEAFLKALDHVAAKKVSSACCSTRF